MSSFKNFAPMLSSLQDQADGKGTIAGSALEDFLSIAGYETPGGGGGGESDLSTAELTITFEGEWCPLQFACAGDNASWPGGPPSPFTSGSTAKVILYKGKAVTFLGTGTATTTGDIEYDAIEEAYIITGDCTMTVTGDNG